MPKSRDLYVNRELSWLEFNQRVLDAAMNPEVPLLDRLFFLTITGSNLDEFFMVRVGGLELLHQAKVRKRDPAGLSPSGQLKRIARRGGKMVADQYACWRKSLLPELAREGIRCVGAGEMSEAEQARAGDEFMKELLPVLSPMSLQGEPFPLLHNLELYVAVVLKGSGKKGGKCKYAAIPVGRGLDRLRSVLGDDGGRLFMFIEDLVISHVDQIFPGRKILEAVPFRVTRNADMSVEEEFAEDLAVEMERVLKQRRTSGCVRLEIGQEVSPELLSFLVDAVGVNRDFVLKAKGPIDLTGLRRLVGLEGYEHLSYEDWPPQPCPDVDPGRSLFEQIARGDILLSHPFESFDPVVRLVTEAADDSDVLAIKHVLYRTSPGSPIILALRTAAENGKYVTALVELKARFDEQRNITWARDLEEAGVQVIYGVKYLKTHSKICMVVRRENEGIVRYLHLGTGNYNDKTARLYTDVGLLTCDADLGMDASSFFNAVTGQSEPRPYRRIAQSPTGLRNRLLELVAAEAARRRQGQRARIMAKMNSLADPALINALYEASQAGVEILLNVRGICCLSPGVKGLSENIRVVSIIDRFLEHSRIFCFHHGGSRRVFISSADWMPRNLDRRVELLVPVTSKPCQRKLVAILDACFSDTVSASEILPDGSYRKVQPTGKGKPFRAQEALYMRAQEAAQHIRRDKRTALTPHVSPKLKNSSDN
jgi:polyphosphate kinase